MLPRTEDQFRAEMEKAKQTLEDQGRNATLGDSVPDEGMLKGDLQLPYSTLPSLKERKWKVIFES